MKVLSANGLMLVDLDGKDVQVQEGINGDYAVVAVKLHVLADGARTRIHQEVDTLYKAPTPGEAGKAEALAYLRLLAKALWSCGKYQPVSHVDQFPG